MSNEPLIRELLERRVGAFHDRDAATLVSLYTDDAVAFELPPPLRFGPAEVVDPEGMLKWFETWQGPIGWEIRDLKIAADGDVAFAYSLNRMSGTKVDGEAVDFWVRQTIGLRRVEGVWKIAHQHTSVPFYMDGTNRAATDLKP